MSGLGFARLAPGVTPGDGIHEVDRENRTVVPPGSPMNHVQRP
jgi:hypothetical protein